MSAWKKISAIIFGVFLLSLLTAAAANAQMYQRCQASTDCEIGDYVFDDSGSPVTTSACTIDIRNPSGTLVVDDAAMSASADGWHSYTANIASPEGFYRAIMACTYSGDTGYHEKSFVLGTTFENLDQSVWGYTSRSLTSFGSLVTDIWNTLTAGLTTTGSIGKLLAEKIESLNAGTVVNRQLLEKVANAPQIKIWYEKGSIVLKAEITNPSTSLTQTVVFSQKLPREVKPEHIIQTDGLKVEYDSAEEAYFLNGEFRLGPRETIVKSVKIKNIWQIADSEIESLKTGAVQAVDFLKGSSYFAQGSMLANDIDTRLDSIVEKQSQAVTPEEYITVYRENLADLEIARKNFETLNSLLLAWEGEKKVVANIGGIQITATWGIILAVIIGLGLLGLTNLYFLSTRGQGFSPMTFPKTSFKLESVTKKAAKPLRAAWLIFLVCLAALTTYLLASSILKILGVT